MTACTYNVRVLNVRAGFGMSELILAICNYLDLTRSMLDPSHCLGLVELTAFPDNAPEHSATGTGESRLLPFLLVYVSFIAKL